MSTIETSSAVCCWCGKPLKRAGGPWWCFTPDCQTRQASWGVQTRVGKKLSYAYLPTPKQTEYHETRLTEALLGYPLTQAGAIRPRMNRMYGGAAGPGKSHALRWDMYRKALTIPNYTGAILRRTMPELKKTHLRAFQRDAGIIGAQFLKSENQLQFENGSIIECGHCEDDDAVQKWLSAEYDQIGFDEGSTFAPDQYLEISTRARTSNPEVQAAGGPWCDVSTNPGGRAWALLRDLFVTHTPDYDLYPGMRGQYDPRFYCYIKARLDDNPYIDPGYASSLAMLTETRYRQLRWGEEFVTDGAFFSEWRETKDGEPWHVKELTVPEGTEWFCSMDWGYNSPGTCLWWAVLPDGHYHIAYEYKFKEQTADEFATAWFRITKEYLRLRVDQIRYIACDPAMKGKTGAGRGESIFETLLRRKLRMQPSDNDRVNGWIRCHQVLREDLQGRPWVTVAPECAYGRRSMPGLVQSKLNPDDLDTDGDDHWADAFRYGVMSRPAPARGAQRLPEAPLPKGSWGWWRNWHLEREKPRGVLR